MIYKILNQTNPAYDVAYRIKLDLLANGGKAMLENAGLFCPQMPGESSVVYQHRLSNASYHNKFGQTVSDYTGTVFSKPISVLPSNNKDEIEEAPEYYQLFGADCDLQGNSLISFMGDQFRRALVDGCSYMGVDFPMSDMEPNNLLEEEALGADRAYIYKIPYECVLDWQCDQQDNYNWLILKNIVVAREDPMSERKTKTINFKIWKKENDVVSWTVYSRTYRIQDEPKPNDDFPEVASGITSFSQIPIFNLHLPSDFWIGNLMYPLAVEYFKNHSALLFAETRSLFPVAFYQVAGEMETLGNENAKTNRGNQFRIDLINKGFLVGDPKDSLSFVEPEGKVYQLMNQQLRELDAEWDSLTFRMAQSIISAKKQSVSAMSKMTDNYAKEIVLGNYALIIKNFIGSLYDFISLNRKEKYRWQILGMDDFHQVDPADLLNMAKAVSAGQINIPSPTFKKHHLASVAFELAPEINHETMLLIKEEIDKSIDMADTMNKTMTPEQQLTYEAQEHAAKGQPVVAGALQQAANDPELGPSGQPMMEPTSHLQSGQHIDSQTVYNQLSDDYKEKDIQWVLHIPWIGPVEVPINSIDFSNKDNWQAAQPEDQEHVDMFADKMKNDNYTKPVILVNNPSNDNKMELVDGHHRSLAALQNNQPINAYIGQIGSDRGPWDVLHSQQKDSKEGSKQKSQQSLQESQQSLQKQAQKQVSKSATAKNGKTK